METSVLMRRELFGSEVRQDSKTKFFSANDLVSAGNKWRASQGMPLFNFNSWSNTQGNKEFIKELEYQMGAVIQTKRGKTGGTWAHPFIIIDIALAIDPKLKIEVYRWVYDELIKYRNESGDSYKKMCGALFVNCSDKNRFNRGVSKTANMIREACGVNDWQAATEKQLKLRDKIHENIALLCDVLRDNNQAVRIGIAKSLEDACC